MIKLRVTIPIEVAKILKRDQEDFELNENKHYNLIYKYLNFSYDETKSKSVYKDETELLQFTLSKENYIKFDASENQNIKRADFFRQLIIEYSKKSAYERELILFKEYVEQIEEAIEIDRKISIEFKGREDILDPYFIASLEKENRNYIVSYSRYKDIIVSYRLKNIKKIQILDEEREEFDCEYIETLKKNFDPFLSFGNEIKVRFNDGGKEYYEKIITNRPKFLRIEKDLYVFEASEYKAMIYFSGFMEMVEIIEPMKLREKMKKRVLAMTQLYNI